MTKSPEERKFTLVVSHLEKAPLERQVLLLARYLDTDPDQEWVEDISDRFPEAFEEALALRASQMAFLLGDKELLSLLSFRQDLSPGVLSELTARVDALIEEIPDVERVLVRALKGEDEKALLVAGALGMRRELGELMTTADLAGQLIVSTVMGREIAGPMAAFAAAAEPELAQNVFSKFLVNVLFDKNPDPPMEEKAERRAIVAARTMLPLLKSPIPDVEYRDDDAVLTREQTRRAWAWTRAIRGK